MTTVDLSAVEAAKVVDARGSACPGPLLEAKKGIGTIKKGEVLEIWSGDERTKNDMPRWCQKVGHEFLGVLVAEGGYDRILIKRLEEDKKARGESSFLTLPKKNPFREKSLPLARVKS